VDRSQVSYWTEKKSDPTYHNDTWGGQRSKEIFSPEERPMDVQLFFQTNFNRSISRSSTSRLLKSWRWSWKVPSHVQINKFSQENMEYYYHYVNWVLSQNPEKLKFVDESHIVPKSVRRNKVLGVINQRVWLQAKDLNEKHCSVTLISSIVNDPPFIFDIRENSNTSTDFVSFIISALSNRFINEGDFIILDNASVHKDSHNVPVLLELLRSFNVQIVYLPTYSPELNPVELIFNKFKAELRITDTLEDIELRICQSLAQISLQNVQRFYSHSLSHRQILLNLESIH